MLLTFLAISSLVIISLNYESTKLKRIAAVVSCVLLILIIELALFAFNNAYFTTAFEGVPHDEYPPLLIIITVAGLLPFVLLSFISRFKNIKKLQLPTPILWVYIIIVPMSMFAIVPMAFFPNIPYQVFLTVIILVLAINILVYYFHDIYSKAYDNMLKSALHEQEKKYYFSQAELMQESVDKVRSIWHDMKIHFSTLKNYTQGNKAATDYLNTLLGDISEGDMYSKTGNIAFDSIINYKLRDIENDNIELALKIAVPPNLKVEAVDVSTIIGNLLDNALDALAKVADNKMLRLDIEYGNSGLYIKVENSFNGEVKHAKGSNGAQFVTLKSGEGHGYGLRNIRQAVEKYNGYMKITHEGFVFSVLVLLLVEGE